MKSLKTVQTIAKVLEILAKIGMIVAFVGTGLCLVGGSVLLATGRDILGSNLLEGFVEIGSLDRVAAATQVFAAMVMCLGAALVGVATVRYLKHELEDGTPFTARGARELLSLGVKTIAYPLGAAILAAILCAYGNVEKTVSNEAEAGLGVALILLSFVFRYGAELEERAKAAGGEGSGSESLPEGDAQP